MATKRTAKPAKRPVKAARASAKTSKAKKAPVKKAVAKKKPATEEPKPPKKAKPVSKKAFKEKSVKTRASVNARKATLDATAVRPEPDSSASQNAIKPKPAPRPPRRSAVERLEDSPPAAGTVLIERVVSSIERELVQIDAIVGKSHVLKAQRTEAERRARTLASLARTLTEVRKLRAEENKLKPQHDDGPEDIETFRLELARKLDRLAAEAQELFPGESNGAGES